MTEIGDRLVKRRSVKRERQRDLAIVALVLDLGVEMAEQTYPALIIKVASIFGSVSRPMRRPASCAAITLVSLTTS
jgi:hypothetical protein